MQFFYILLSIVMISFALMVIISKNPVHSIFYLILVFCCGAMVLLSLGAEFLGLMFVIVYVGAVSVLFLFVIMMLNIKIIEINENLIKYLPLSLFIFLIIFFQIYVYTDFIYIPKTDTSNYINWALLLNKPQNLELLGEVLYTNFFHFFLISSLILLLAMLGSIVLTLNHTKYVLRQKIYEQNLRNWKTTVRLHTLKSK